MQASKNQRINTFLYIYSVHNHFNHKSGAYQTTNEKSESNQSFNQIKHIINKQPLNLHTPTRFLKITKEVRHIPSQVWVDSESMSKGTGSEVDWIDVERNRQRWSETMSKGTDGGGVNRCRKERTIDEKESERKQSEEKWIEEKRIEANQIDSGESNSLEFRQERRNTRSRFHRLRLHLPLFCCHVAHGARQKRP